MQEEEKKVKRAYTRTETSPRNRLSSINFKKSNSIQAMHNDRDLPPSYLIGEDFEINRNSTEALELKNQIIAEAIKAYNEKKPAKAPAFKAKSYEWSAVVNLKPESTMQDLEELAKHFNQKYGFQCYQIAIHRDEGHLNEKGEKVINHHAHLEFITLDKETGKNNYNRQKISPSVLRQIQSEVAEILQMQRGQDKRLSGVKRIEPRKYAQMKEQEKANTKELKQELLTQKQINARIEAERKAWIAEKTHTAEEYKKLRALKEQHYTTIQDLEAQLKILNETLKIKNSKINSLESDLKQKEQKNEELLKKINEMDLRGNSELLITEQLDEANNEIDELNQENNELFSKNQTLKKENYILRACFNAFAIFLKGEKWQKPLNYIRNIFNLDDFFWSYDADAFNKISKDIETYTLEKEKKQNEPTHQKENQIMRRK